MDRLIIESQALGIQNMILTNVLLETLTHIADVKTNKLLSKYQDELAGVTNDFYSKVH